MAWTKEQEMAIYKRGNNMMISAGAGSGKTAVLSERILDYCLKGNDIRRVLVLTFTNAAAREMKERIRKKLLDHGLYEQADFIDAAYITTFDAYSLALVKKYYYKLGISKDVSIMDASLIAIKRRDIIQGLFTEYYENENPKFFSFLKKYTKQDDKEVITIVETLCSKLELILHLSSFIKDYPNRYFSKEKLNHIIEEYNIYTKECVGEFEVLLDEFIEVCSIDVPSEKLYEELVTFKERLEGLCTYEQYYAYLSNYSFPRVSPKADERVKESKELCNKTLKNLKDTLFSKYSQTADMFKELEAVREDTLFLLEVCNEVLSRLWEYKKSVMLFDYNDIAKYAIELVENYPEIKEELKQYYNEILVDEYQDTSDIQETFLNAIENHNLYMVGDIKQSIYRFRNANPYIFKSKYQTYADQPLQGEKIDLTYNFRSRHEVLQHINALFNRLMTDSCGDANYIMDHQMTYGLKQYEDYPQNMDFNIEVLRYKDETGQYKEFTNEEIEAFIAAKKIKEIMKQSPKVLKKNQFVHVEYSDFAILMDKAKSFVTFKRVFEYLNIPISIEADLDLKDSILPKLFSNIVLLLSKTQKEEFDIPYRHALTSLARSFLYAYSDEDIYKLIVLQEPYPILEDIKNLMEDAEISYPDLFYKICFKLEIYEKLSMIGDVDNSIVVLEYIYQMFLMFQSTSMSLQEISDYLANIFDSDVKLSYKLSSGNQNSVRMMTIHKSKGLEFPYCIFPLLSSNFNKQDIRASIGYHADYGIYIPYADEGKSNTIIKTLVEKKLLSEDISEKVRLLYVALTRAREKIILIMEDKEYQNISPKCFSNFQQMITYYDTFHSYNKDICLDDYFITSDYKKRRTIQMNQGGGEVLTYQPLPLPKEITDVRISKELKDLPTLKQKESIELGLEFHSALEVLDFSHPNVEELPVSGFVKNTLEKVLKHEIFKNVRQAKTYHEHEFYFSKGQEQYHGIIDFFAVYEDHIDILDYKLSNTDSPEYIRQLEIYKAYIQSKWKKKIRVYLLSILKAEIKELDI